MSEATLILKNMRGGCVTVDGTVHTLFRFAAGRPTTMPSVDLPVRRRERICVVPNLDANAAYRIESLARAIDASRADRELQLSSRT